MLKLKNATFVYVAADTGMVTFGGLNLCVCVCVSMYYVEVKEYERVCEIVLVGRSTLV